ncbi:MAG: DNA-methyltransferase [Planctomycetota bacterium]|jgi:site-specific DNA-methyltransferase (adenine-specific)
MKPYYDHKGITIYCGDCREVLPELAEASIHVVVTSPPYGDVRTYEGGRKPEEWLDVIDALYRPLGPGGVCMWNVADQTVDGSEIGTPYRQALRFLAAGFNLHDTMIYVKRGVTFPDANRYHNAFEFMFVASKGAPAHFNGIEDRRNRYAGTTIHGLERQRDGRKTKPSRDGSRIPTFGLRYNWWEMSNRQRSEHPATMPPAMARDHILTWSAPGEIVLDPFAGSGTTLDEARAQQRRSIGIEIEEKYCEIAANRLAQETLW